MLVELFKHCLWQSKFECDIIRYSYDVERNNKSVYKSNKGGFQSDFLDQSQEVIHPLINHIKEETAKFSKAAFNIDKQYSIGSMWLNINRSKDYNLVHTHPHCDFSGVYYISTPKDCGMLSFENPYKDGMESHWLNVERPVEEYNLINSHTIKVIPTRYRCYIFPSYFKHSVEPNMSEEDRISISFNLTPVNL